MGSQSVISGYIPLNAIMNFRMFHVYTYSSAEDIHISTLIWVGFLGVRFGVKGGGLKFALVSKTRFSTKTSLILLISASFFQNISIFLAKIVPLLKIIV